MAEEKKTILIIEDNIAILNIYQKICEKRFDAFVVTADDGKKALKIVRERKVDLILSDLMLPEVSGFDVIRTLKSDPKYKDIPIVIISAVGDKGHVMLGIKAGANDFLVKPAPQRLIVDKISQYLNLEPKASIS